MSEPLDQAIHEWAGAISQLHANVEDQPGDSRAAQEALAHVWSAFGYQPRMDVWRLLTEASEIGYLVALRRLRNGDLDDEIRIARPHLANGD